MDRSKMVYVELNYQFSLHGGCKGFRQDSFFFPMHIDEHRAVIKHIRRIMLKESGAYLTVKRVENNGRMERGIPRSDYINTKMYEGAGHGGNNKPGVVTVREWDGREEMFTRYGTNVDMVGFISDLEDEIALQLTWTDI